MWRISFRGATLSTRVLVWVLTHDELEHSAVRLVVDDNEGNAVEDVVETEEVGALTLKGLLKPVPTFNVLDLRTAPSSSGSLQSIEENEQ